MGHTVESVWPGSQSEKRTMSRNRPKGLDGTSAVCVAFLAALSSSIVEPNRG